MNRDLEKLARLASLMTRRCVVQVDAAPACEVCGRRYGVELFSALKEQSATELDELAACEQCQKAAHRVNELVAVSAQGDGRCCDA